MALAIDQQARDDAAEAKAGLSAHERECAERYKGIQASFATGSAKMKELADGQRNLAALLVGIGLSIIGTLTGATAVLAFKIVELAASK